jgi:UDP-3-O-[3-hydroxymyristoyl] glucosamine N-acyltransferase
VGEADPPVRLADLAAVLGRVHAGDGEVRITGVAAIDRAGPGDLAFVRSPAFAGALAASRAGAVILPEGVDPGGRPAIRSPNPALDFARAARHLAPSTPTATGIDPAAHVDRAAKVDATAVVEPAAVIRAGAIVGPRTIVHAGAVVSADVQVGADCVIHARAVLREGTCLGNRVVVQPGAVIGAEGFGFVTDEAGARVRMPHLGRVVVEDDVEIGANTTIDRGALGETRIRRGAKIDNLVQIAHNCDVGEDAIIVAQSGLSGSTRVGAGAVVMAQAGTTGHVEIGAGAFVGARAGVHKDVAAGAAVFGSPQQERGAWHRSMAALVRLPELVRRLRAVERALGLRGRPAGDPSRRRGDSDDEACG